MPTQSDVSAGILSEPALAEAWREVDLAGDEILFNAGDAADAFYVVREGEIEVFSPDANGNRIVLERLGPGSSFGELALLDGGLRAASVRAVTPARLEVLDRAAFLEGMSTSARLSGVVLSFLGARLRRTVHYLHDVTEWAAQVAQGDYDGARRAIESGRAAADDPNIARFTQTFETMIAAVRSREERLAGEINRLRIQIDSGRRKDEVAAITDTDFFRELAERAERSRSRHRESVDDGSGTQP
jgi:CRP-like cAMP-binding protein